MPVIGHQGSTRPLSRPAIYLSYPHLTRENDDYLPLVDKETELRYLQGHHEAQLQGGIYSVIWANGPPWSYRVAATHRRSNAKAVPGQGRGGHRHTHTGFLQPIPSHPSPPTLFPRNLLGQASTSLCAHRGQSAGALG